MYSDPTQLIKKMLASNLASSTLLTGPDGILRVYGFGEADEITAGPPYVVLSAVGGEPDNFLSDAPTNDNLSVKVDIYAAKPAACRDATRIVIAAIQVQDGRSDGVYVDTWGGLARDPDTREFVSSFFCSSVVHRS